MAGSPPLTLPELATGYWLPATAFPGAKRLGLRKLCAAGVSAGDHVSVPVLDRVVDQPVVHVCLRLPLASALHRSRGSGRVWPWAVADLHRGLADAHHLSVYGRSVADH